ncbi:MAG: SDR family oxidoreductase [Pseudomonadota bacterium]
MAEDRPVAIVTGASSGIGAACALRLANSGFNVAVNYAGNADGAAATTEACRQAGAEALRVQGDVSDDDQCRRIVERTVNEWGRIDVLINNAGRTKFVRASDLDALDGEDFTNIAEVNVAGPYLMARFCRPHLMKSPYASIVNVSSHSGISGIGSSIAYAASKGALNTLTLSLARSLAPEIRVNAVCPGFVDTPWHEKSPFASKTEEGAAAFRDRIAEKTALKRLTTPDDVAEAACWFALGGKAITGVLLTIDGGTHLTVGSPIQSVAK